MIIVDGIRIALARSRGLRRFEEAQAPIYSRAIYELRRGRKEGHWIWFIFPQATGLGSSFNARIYALSRAEAKDYLKHPTLSRRLLDCTDVVTGWLERGRPLERVMGNELDAIKFRSSMELFASVGDSPVFERALALSNHGSQTRLRRVK